MHLRGADRLEAWQRSLVTSKSLPMCQLMILKDGKKVYDYSAGTVNAANAASEAVITKGHKLMEKPRHVNEPRPCQGNELYRIYSMTKPITAVAILQLFECGKLLLSDPVHKYLGPAWKKKNMRVWDVDAPSGNERLPTKPCKRSITIMHLLTHTSGISYGFDRDGILNKVDKMYYEKGLYPSGSQRKMWYDTLENFVNRLANFPLVCQPGSAWIYGFNCDVLGRIVEVVAKMDLFSYFKKYIFEPIGMSDTSYFVRPEDRERFTVVTKAGGQDISMLSLGKGSANGESSLCSIDILSGDASSKYKPRAHNKTFFEGGSGLVSSARDYAIFAQMLLDGGVAPNGKRILSSASLHLATLNHLFDASGRSCDIRDIPPPMPGYSEVYSPGWGSDLAFLS